MRRRSIAQRERDAIVKAWGNKCAYCKGSNGQFVIDHIVPVASGGTCDLENLCLACAECNGMKSDTRLPEMHEGLLLGVAARRARNIRKRLRNKMVAPKKKKDHLCIPTKDGGKWMFDYAQSASELVVFLEAILAEGVTEVIEGRGDFLPKRIVTRSKLLDEGFFVNLGISYEVGCKLIASVAHLLMNEGGWLMRGLSWGGVRHKKGGYTFNFYVSEQEILGFVDFVKRGIGKQSKEKRHEQHYI